MQLLPFADEKTVTQIEENVKRITSVTDLFRSGRTAEEIALMLLDGLEPNILDGNEPQYKCTCSRERTRDILASLSEDELEKMAAEQEQTEVCCHFCSKKYVFTPSELRGIKK